MDSKDFFNFCLTYLQIEFTTTKAKIVIRLKIIKNKKIIVYKKAFSNLLSFWQPTVISHVYSLIECIWTLKFRLNTVPE